MNLATAYAALSLEPLDDFIRHSEGQVGATTFMLVTAALFLRSGLGVVLEMRNSRQARLSRDLVLQYMDSLNQLPAVPQVRHIEARTGANRSIQFTSGGNLLVFTPDNRRTLVNLDGKLVLRDPDWVHTTRMRLKEPLDRVHYMIRQPEGFYSAYDPAGDFLFDITEEGSAEVLANDPTASRHDEIPDGFQHFMALW